MKIEKRDITNYGNIFPPEKCSKHDPARIKRKNKVLRLKHKLNRILTGEFLKQDTCVQKAFLTLLDTRFPSKSSGAPAFMLYANRLLAAARYIELAVEKAKITQYQKAGIWKAKLETIHKMQDAEAKIAQLKEENKQLRAMLADQTSK